MAKLRLTLVRDHAADDSRGPGLVERYECRRQYALLGYDTDRSLEELAPEDKRTLDPRHRALHDEVMAATGASMSVIAH